MMPEAVILTVLATYSVAATFIIVALLLYVRLLRRTCSMKDLSNESPYTEIDPLTEANDNINDGENNSFVHRNARNLQRTRSAPIQQRPESIYNSEEPHPIETENRPERNLYEQIPDSSSELNYFTTIIQNISSSLTHIYDQGEQLDDTEIYKMFKNELLRIIRNEEICKNNKHHYERIDEQIRSVSELSVNNDGACVISGASEKESLSAANVNGGGFKTKSYGSGDHLKHLTENKTLQSQGMEQPYLKPKQFSPNSDCPDSLRVLCESRNSDTCSISRGKTRQHQWNHRQSSPALSLRSSTFTARSIGEPGENEDSDTSSTITITEQSESDQFYFALSSSRSLPGSNVFLGGSLERQRKRPNQQAHLDTNSTKMKQSEQGQLIIPLSLPTPPWSLPGSNASIASTLVGQVRTSNQQDLDTHIMSIEQSEQYQVFSHSLPSSPRSIPRTNVFVTSNLQTPNQQVNWTKQRPQVPRKPRSNSAGKDYNSSLSSRGHD